MYVNFTKQDLISAPKKRIKKIIVPPKVPPPKVPLEKPEEKLEKAVEPEWTNFPSVRTVDGLGKVLSDIDSHLPAGHIYKDSDRITWAHETSHGIASSIRMKFGQGRKINGFYCLDNRAVIIAEPRTTISTVASLVPVSLRGGVFNLYLVNQASSWNDTPLYICDEYVAYTNGSACRKELGIQNRSETVTYMMEFNIYSICLAMAIKKNDPGYDDKQFKAFLMWSIDRTMKIYQGEEGANSYLSKFRSGGDAESIRKFAQSYFGVNWCKKTLQI